MTQKHKSGKTKETIDTTEPLTRVSRTSLATTEALEFDQNKLSRCARTLSHPRAATAAAPSPRTASPQSRAPAAVYFARRLAFSVPRR